MSNSLQVLFLSLAVGAGPVDSRLEQVYPASNTPTVFARSPGQWRAVVVLHGLFPHPISDSKVHRAEVLGYADQLVEVEAVAAVPAED